MIKYTSDVKGQTGKQYIVYFIRSNIMELQATFSDGLLDFYLTGDSALF